ncbi:MAG: SpoIID/LytB domain-containing protein [Candidatus Magasanikbacteria bacterium]|jgi:stage II sporulation protein D
MKKYLLVLFFSLILALPVRAEEILATSSLERELVEMPSIRVGLLKTKDPIKFKSEIDYEIYSGDEVVGLLSAGEEAKISYKNGKYFLTSDSFDLESETFWRLKPTEDSSVFELPGCKRTITGRKLDFCAYRGVLEYRYGKTSKMPYLINELPLEDYMKGIAETDNNSAEGYIKAVLVAARSYAYKNISFSPPTEKRLFDVFASTVDQLYLGYNSEKQMPRVAQFAQETAGEMVTYNGNVVTTPYFSRSNGKTKTWKNSQGKNDRPWLVSVECQYDKKKKQLGHGIGMSTHDALMRATKDGWDYIQLLKLYYSDTEVEKVY